MPKNILIVDDDLAFRDIALDILEDHGLRGVVVRTAEDVLDWLKTQKPDAFLLDITMPGIGGIELLRHLKSDPSTSAIPVVVCTVSTGQHFKDEVLGMGASDFLPKPTCLEALASCFRKILGIPYFI